MDALTPEFTFYPVYSKAHVILIVNENNVVLNKNIKTNGNCANIPENLKDYRLKSYSVNKAGKEFFDKYKNFLRLADNSTVAGQLFDLRVGTAIILLYVLSSANCYVVTERYFNDGTHKTITKAVSTNAVNISSNYLQDSVSDTFVTAFDTEEDALNYLRSPVYISNVRQRSRNRRIKAGV